MNVLCSILVRLYPAFLYVLDCSSSISRLIQFLVHSTAKQRPLGTRIGKRRLNTIITIRGIHTAHSLVMEEVVIETRFLDRVVRADDFAGLAPTKLASQRVTATSSDASEQPWGFPLTFHTFLRIRLQVSFVLSLLWALNATCHCSGKTTPVTPGIFLYFCTPSDG